MCATRASDGPAAAGFWNFSHRRPGCSVRNIRICAGPVYRTAPKPTSGEAEAAEAQVEIILSTRS